MLPWRLQVCRQYVCEYSHTHTNTSSALCQCGVSCGFLNTFSLSISRSENRGRRCLQQKQCLTVSPVTACVTPDDQTNWGKERNPSGSKTSIKFGAITLLTCCATAARTCSAQRRGYHAVSQLQLSFFFYFQINLTCLFLFELNMDV